MFQIVNLKIFFKFINLKWNKLNLILKNKTKNKKKEKKQMILILLAKILKFIIFLVLL